MADDDPLTAYLTGVRERAKWPTARILAPAAAASAGDVPRLLAAVEAVRERADEWEARAKDIVDRAHGRTYVSDQLDWCVTELREILSAVLLGEGGTDAQD